MVLLELISGLTPFGEIDVLEWVQERRKSGHMWEIVDQQLKEEAVQEQEVTLVVETALLCVAADPTLRPSMGKVIRLLQGEIQPWELPHTKQNQEEEEQGERQHSYAVEHEMQNNHVDEEGIQNLGGDGNIVNLVYGGGHLPAADGRKLCTSITEEDISLIET
eukprot:TRINITY_DN1293_c0_g1_i1.p2 TRINITY_DN1293_c0_g1~~TRINITY_DN1293_c0_g1_i1.p2  ORF type:complete len:163 (+),score=63.59 TRINITY_DN1293_c0_g1_i1:380-868(+)